nr:MAG TPA: hypothetical protein [Caudoviricetes sp.]
MIPDETTLSLRSLRSVSFLIRMKPYLRITSCFELFPYLMLSHSPPIPIKNRFEIKTM